MRDSMIYTLYYWFIYMHWLKYIRLNRKGRLKNMLATCTTLKIAMLANVSEAHSTSVISSVYQCVTGPLWHEPSSPPFGCTWLWLVNKMLIARPLNLDDFCGLLVEMSIYQLLWYSVAFLIEVISYGHTFITIHDLCPGSTCNATVVSLRYRRFTTVMETLTTVALLVEPDFYGGCIAQL